MCLETPGCGWCAFGAAGGIDGLGVCMEGGLAGPLGGVCSALNVSLGNEALPKKVFNWSVQATAAPTWNFDKCPAENECLNNHHTCEKNEDCTNLDEQFKCNCKTGFQRADE